MKKKYKVRWSILIMILVAIAIAIVSLYYYIPLVIDFYKVNIEDQPISKDQYIKERVDDTHEELVYEFFIDEVGEIHSESETQYEYKIWNEEMNIYKNIRKSEKLNWVKGDSIRVEANVIKYSISCDVDRIYNDDGKITNSWMYYEIPILNVQSENDYIEYEEWKNEQIDSAYKTYAKRFEVRLDLTLRTAFYIIFAFIGGLLIICLPASFVLEKYDEVLRVEDVESKGDETSND